MEEKLSNKEIVLSRVRTKRIGSKVISKTPKVSVIIPAYNISSFIVETLDSVFAQTFKDFEVIVVNDGSTDSKELEIVLEDYADRIIYCLQENSGASKARNVAICLARGELLAFLDGDDIWLPDYLESQINFLERTDFDMVYCDADFFGDPYSAGKTYMGTSPSEGDVTPISLIDASCNVITSGTVLKVNKLLNSGLFDPSAVRAQDFDLWFRLSKNGVKIGYQRKILLKYRFLSTSLSGSNVQRAKRNVSILEFVREKYDLTKGESDVIQNQLEFCYAEVDLEQGKFSLVQGEYEQAKKYLIKANKYYRKPKLTLMSWLMAFSPSFARLAFKKIRPAEFSFITSNTVSE